MFMNFKVMVRLKRLDLKMWVQVAVSNELQKKTNSITRELVFFGVCFVSIIIDGLKESCFFVV